MHTINTPKGYVVLNPLTNSYHTGETKLFTPKNGVERCQEMQSGQPLLIIADTKAKAVAMAYSSYDDEADTGTPRKIDWLVLDSGEEAQSLADVISTFPAVAVSILPHPTQDKWLVPYADFFLNILTESPEKTALENALAPYLLSLQTSEQVMEAVEI